MSPTVAKSPGKGDNRDAEEGTVSGGMLASISINSGVPGISSIVSRFPAPATLVLAVAFATLGGLEDGVDVLGVHVRVAAYALEDRKGFDKEGCRVAFAPSTIAVVKADIIIGVKTKPRTELF
jgi:hypothetical protein